MGAGQSKTETLFDRYPDNEIVKDIKLTPTMVNQINNTVATQPEVDVEALKRDIRPEIEAELRNDINNTVRQELEQEYYEKLAQIAELRDKERAEFEAETIRIQQSNTETNQLETQNQELLEKLEKTIDQANKAAQDHIKQSEEALAAQRRELIELQQRENERLLETTTPIFKSRKVDRPVCPDIEASLNQCYSENKDRSLLCAEIVRQYQSCLETEKQNYFKANLSA